MVRGFIYEKSLTMIVSCSQALCMSQWRCVKCTIKKQVRDRGGGATVCVRSQWGSLHYHCVTSLTCLCMHASS